MDVLEAIRRRASTRAYLDKPVDRATVETILEAARLMLDAEVRHLATSIARTPASVLRMKKIAINRVLELQGFRTVAYMGTETDVVVYGTEDVGRLKAHVQAHGLKSALREFAVDTARPGTH